MHKILYKHILYTIRLNPPKRCSFKLFSAFFRFSYEKPQAKIYKKHIIIYIMYAKRRFLSAAKKHCL